MSDLHKLLLNRVRKQEKAFGLGMLSEDQEEKDFSASPQAVSPSKYMEIDNELLNAYKSKREVVFPIQEKYGQFQTYYTPPERSKDPIFVCHHGAGSSGMTFTVLAEAIRKQWKDACNEGGEGSPGIFTFDARGHGETQETTNDFSLDTMTEDFRSVFKVFQEKYQPRSSIFFIGHSLGGSILTNYLMKYPEGVAGLVMLDIVEETATQSLNTMTSFIDKRPKSFISLQNAIDWHCKEICLLHNLESAKLSVPALLYKQDKVYKWYADLKKTQPFWNTWFKGLSSNFITCGQNTAKLLILAGHENLDTALIIGQMQGKFQLIVFNNTLHAGHFIHEDIPHQISMSLIDFVKRNESPEEYMQKELGFKPKWGGKINN